MASTPPPPPGQYPPVYDRRAMRAYRRTMQAQQRAMRYQMRAQRRTLQRRSIVGPLILLSVGAVCLLAQVGEISWPQFFLWYIRFWPAVLIVAGVILLAEWALGRDRGVHGRVLGGGTVFLLILLASAGLASRTVEHGLDWTNRTFGDGYSHWDHLFGDRNETVSSLSHSLPSASTLVIRNPHGDVIVAGSSSDGQVHVSVRTRSYAWKSTDAARKARELQPTFSEANGALSLNIHAVDGGQSDLTIEMPRSAPLTIQADRGDVTVNEMSAPVDISADHGDVSLSGIGSSVTVHVNDDDASLTLHSVHGPVSIAGHGGDIDISDVTGSLALQGDFFGSTSLQHIDGPVRFTTSRTQFSAARLDDQFSVDNDSLDADALLGPVVLHTQDKNITLDRVQGSVDVSNSNGSVDITATTPLDAISVQNKSGSVDIGLPGSAGFSANAKTHNGDMENDFGLKLLGPEDSHSLVGTVNGGGPTVTVVTSDGDVTLRRSSVAPLPKQLPADEPITRVPAAPRAPRAPVPPKPPAPPAASGTY